MKYEKCMKRLLQFLSSRLHSYKVVYYLIIINLNSQLSFNGDKVKVDNQSSPNLERRYNFMSLNWQKDRSAIALVIGEVRKLLFNEDRSG